MADAEFARQAGAETIIETGSLSRAVNIAGALVSLALVAGVGVWGYKLMMRDVSGVPVVRAIEGPMRIQPKDPGGRRADYQGLAVNAVAARGEAAPTPDQLVLAPRDVSLLDEDAPVKTLAAATSEAQPVKASADSETPVSETPVIVTTSAVAAFQEGSVDALVKQLTQGVTPLDQVEADDAVQDAALQIETDASPEDAPKVAAPVIARNIPGVKRSLRPTLRPADLSVVHKAAAPSNAPAPETKDINPNALPSGARLAQLGAYESPEVAKSEWDKLAVRFADYIDGKGRVIQKASSGGRTFYRLRVAGFEDLSDARRFCSTLVAEGADCIPVIAR